MSGRPDADVPPPPIADRRLDDGAPTSIAYWRPSDPAIVRVLPLVRRAWGSASLALVGVAILALLAGLTAGVSGSAGPREALVCFVIADGGLLGAVVCGVVGFRFDRGSRRAAIGWALGFLGLLAAVPVTIGAMR